MVESSMIGSWESDHELAGVLVHAVNWNAMCLQYRERGLNT
jgi:hypothetical protein